MVWLIAGIVDALLAIRFLLRALGASIGSGFVQLVYGLTTPLTAPFRDTFPVSGRGYNIIEPGTLIAIAIYSLAAWGVVALVRVLLAPPSRPTH
ncbi:MAG: YggT family protein [Candidatus Dormibacteraceae bacterium]